MSSNHVVYRHFTVDNGVEVWRYVGVGRPTRAVEWHCRSKLYREWIEANGRPQVEILYEGLTAEVAWAIEELLIAKYKRTCDGGTLLNASTGGRHAARGRITTDESRAKLSAFHTGQKRSPEARSAMSEAAKGKPKSAEHRANIAAAKRGRKRLPFTAEARANMSAVQLARSAAKRAATNQNSQGISI
jgi:hypothetical protein